ncbi:hypothetical protein GQ42DRAFT_159904 [Ramicandelaber brevisporus]|nr:hypothetical protein GQ42DRAFT_159904 [Ramicandelaber brevisporus]
MPMEDRKRSMVQVESADRASVDSTSTSLSSSSSTAAAAAAAATLPPKKRLHMANGSASAVYSDDAGYGSIKSRSPSAAPMVNGNHSSSPSSVPPMPAPAVTAGPLPNEEFLAQFQKEALWRQMQVYKRQCADIKSEVNHLSTEKRLIEDALSRLASTIALSVTDASAIASSIGTDIPSELIHPSSSDAVSESPVGVLLRRMVIDYNSVSQQANTGIVHVDELLGRWRSAVGKLLGDIAKALSKLQLNSTTSATASSTGTADNAATLNDTTLLDQAREQVKRASVLDVQLVSVTAERDRLYEQLKSANDKISKLERTADRKQCTTLSNYKSEPHHSSVPPQSSSSTVSAIDSTTAAATATSSSSSMVPTTTAATATATTSAQVNVFSLTGVQEQPNTTDNNRTNDAGESAAVSNSASNMHLSMVNSNNSTGNVNHNGLIAELESARAIAEQRLAEIEQLMRDKANMAAEIDMINLKNGSITDARILESTPYKQALAARDFFQADAQQKRADADRLAYENHELSSERTSFREQIEAEESTRRQALIADLRKIETDLARIRNQRDLLQQQSSAANSREERLQEQLSNLEKLAEFRLSMIGSLQNEIKHYKLHMAAESGDTFKYNAILNEPVVVTATATTTATTTAIPQQQQQQNGTNNDGSDGNSNSNNNNNEPQHEPMDIVSNDNTDASNDTVDNTDELTRLRQCVDAWSKRYGIQFNRPPPDSEAESIEKEPESNVDSSSTSVKVQIDVLNQRVEELKFKCNNYSQAEAQLITEIERLSKSFGELEQQLSSVTLTLNKRDEQMNKFEKERVKFNQKFIALNKQKDALTSANNHANRLAERQLNYIQSLEENDKSLTMQHAALERELHQLQAELRTVRDRLQDVSGQHNELQSSFSTQEKRLDELSNLLTERHSQLSSLDNERSVALSEVESLKKKVEQLQRLADSVENQSEVQRLYTEYRDMVKCPTCSIRFKSHVLSRCMHVFCKECIDSRLNTRQRKCPQCQETFGVNDVRQIYL